MVKSRYEGSNIGSLAISRRLRRENQRLAEKLRQAETIIEVQKKVSELLGLTPSHHAESSARTATDLNHERSL